MWASSSRQAASTWGVTAYMRALAIKPAPGADASAGGAKFTRPARHVLADGLAHRGIEWRRREPAQQFLPDDGSALGGVARAGIGPVLEVRPVRQQRPVERRLVARQRVCRAEEVSAGGDALDRLHRQVIVAEVDRLEDLG